MRRILSIWLPDLPIERWRRRESAAPPAEPEPFALTLKGPHGLALYAVNGAARREGLTPGLALTAARARVPHLAVHPAEPEADQSALERLAQCALRFSPLIALDGADGLLIDTTGASHLFGGEPALMEAVRSFLRRLGFSAHLALAPTPAAAAAFARFDPAARRAGCLIEPEALRARLGALPVSALRLEARTLLLLKRFGLKRIADLYGLPRGSLERRFASRAMGERVLARLDAALGLRHEPLRAIAPPAPAEARLVCAEPIESLAAVEAGLARLAEDLAKILGERGEGARALTFALHRCDGEIFTAHAGTALASRDARHITHLLSSRLEGLDTGFGIETLVLEARETEPLGAEQTSLAACEPAARGAGESVARLIDRITVRLGAEALQRPALAESHVPERAQTLAPAIAASGAPAPARSAAAPAPAGPTAPRPFRLLERPELVAVMAEVPDGPPLRFTWRRAAHLVARARGPERIAGEWWTDPACDLPVRDYYEVEDAAGRRFWLFRSGLYGEGAREGPPQWYVHGLYG